MGGGEGTTGRVAASLGRNVAVSILESTRELLKDHLQRTGTYTVLEPDVAASRVEPTAYQAAEVARVVGAEQAIVVRITHVGSTARVRLTVYWAHNAEVAYWDSIVVAGGPDELDPVLERLAHAMQIGRPVRDSAELETVTVKEGQALNRRNASRSFGIHIFTLLPLNAAGGSTSVMPAGGLYWLYDARTWMADVAFDIGGQGDRAYYGMAIGGYYPLLREDFTPYIGGVFRWAYMNLGGSGQRHRHAADGGHAAGPAIVDAASRRGRLLRQQLLGARNRQRRRTPGATKHPRLREPRFRDQHGNRLLSPRPPTRVDRGSPHRTLGGDDGQRA